MKALVTAPEEIARLDHPVLLVHGRDDHIVPVETSLRLNRLIERSDVHLFGQCGHWSHLDRDEEFHALAAAAFLSP